MKKDSLKTILMALVLPLLLAISAQHARAADQPMPTPGSMPGDDELLKEDAAPEEEVFVLPKAEDLPPIKLVYIKGGCYQMGDFAGIGDDDERPAHKVCVEDFYLAETEVTQELFELVAGYNPSLDKDPAKPVTNVSWHRAVQFIERLNGITDGFYRLPTEAEWEYAAREGGKNVLWSGTSNEGELGDYAWFVDNSNNSTQPVATKKPNALGIYDLSGNVWEWVEDYLDFEYYDVSPSDNPFGPDMSLWRVVRGGSFIDEPQNLRTTFRYGFVPNLLAPHIGFRLAE